MLKKLLVIVKVIGLIGLLNACSIDPKDAYKQFQPSTLPIRNITPLNGSLQCFDALLARSQLKPVYISSEGIPMQFGGDSMSSGLTMLITTIGQLHSNVFRYIELPTAPENTILEPLGISKISVTEYQKYASIYNQWNKGKTSYTMPYPDYIIKGGVQVDKNIIANGIGIDFAVENANLGANKDDMVSVITMDMRVSNTATFEVEHSTVNSISVYRQGTAGDLGGKIKKAGVYFNFSLDKSEGTSQAIRTLMQLNTIEILGQLAHVPYQQCLSSAIEPPEKFASQSVTPVPVTTTTYTPPPTPIEKNPVNNTEVSFNIAASKNQYHVNDVLTFQAQALENAYVHCFYQNYQGKIWKIFPNQIQVSDYLVANKLVNIPAQNPAFEIAFDRARVTEQVMCLAAREKLDSDFSSSAVSSSSMLPVSSLSQVLENYQRKTQSQISKQLLPIQVK